MKNMKGYRVDTVKGHICIQENELKMAPVENEKLPLPRLYYIALYIYCSIGTRIFKDGLNALFLLLLMGY